MLKIYNTLSRSVEEFKPIDPNNVRIYSCGPTVYSTQHLGNMRSAFFTDLLKKTLRHLCGYTITHVVNITDVGHLTGDNEWDADHGEDRMEKGARKDGITARDVAERYTKEYINDLKRLQIEDFEFVTPDTDNNTIKNKMPRATDHIQQQIEMVQELEKKWFTYIIPWDGIYMDTNKMEDYGVLTNKKNLENIELWARVWDSGKRKITDFALRKFNITSKKRDMERESPWWVGFPGWHIECSAMSRQYLWDHFDIHTGGMEHIPIHHTNEIAQSECCWSNKPWVNYRVHNQWLMMNGKKIAKSDGNVAFISDVKSKEYTSEDLRYFFFQANYRSFQDFTRESLEAASKGRKKLKLVSDENYPRDEVVAPLLDDLNTPIFLANIQKYGISDKLNNIFHLYKPEEKVTIPDDIAALAEQRRQAKINKDRTTADTIRNQLNKLGWVMNDGEDDYQIIKK